MEDTFDQIDGAPQGVSAAPTVALAIAAGLAIVIGSVRRRAPRELATSADRRAALSTYLREHLSGSDVAIQIVERLRRVHAGTRDGRLFGTLFQEFQDERDTVRAVL